MSKLIITTEEEKKDLEELITVDNFLSSLREKLRDGQEIKTSIMREVLSHYDEHVLT
jgi:hypothetical protein